MNRFLLGATKTLFKPFKKFQQFNPLKSPLLGRPADRLQTNR